MTIDQIREALAMKISSDEQWINKLDESDPGHCGVDDWDVNLSYEDIWVDVPAGSFNFKNAQFDFELLLGSSNREDGTTMSFSRVANGSGTFNFSSTNDDVEIQKLDISFDLDLFKDE